MVRKRPLLSGQQAVLMPIDAMKGSPQLSHTIRAGWPFSHWEVVLVLPHVRQVIFMGMCS